MSKFSLSSAALQKGGGQIQKKLPLSSGADHKGETGAGLELCPCAWCFLWADSTGASTQQCLQSTLALLMGFIDLVFSKLPQVVQTCPGEPRGVQLELQTLPAHGGQTKVPRIPSHPHPPSYLVGQGPPVIITLTLGSGPWLSPGPMRCFTWFTSRTP